MHVMAAPSIGLSIPPFFFFIEWVDKVTLPSGGPNRLGDFSI